jgi:hypothetical protein
LELAEIGNFEVHVGGETGHISYAWVNMPAETVEEVAEHVSLPHKVAELGKGRVHMENVLIYLH